MIEESPEVQTEHSHSSGGMFLVALIFGIIGMLPGAFLASIREDANSIIIFFNNKRKK